MFGRGKINISIQRTGYAPGDTISGTVTLALNKPVRARMMTLSLIGEYITTVVHRRHLVPGASRLGGSLRDRSRGMLMSDATRKSAPTYELRKSAKTVRLCGFEEQLAGEMEYSQSSEYHFEIKTTADMPTSSVVNWYLLAKLDIPHRRDITKKARITIE
jgi:hypothetical protein